MQVEKHTTTRQLGAVLKYEVDQGFTHGSGTFTNNTDAVIVLQPGVLLTGTTTKAVYTETAPAEVTAMCVSTSYVQPGQTVSVAWLENGPAILNLNEMDLPQDAAKRTAVEASLRALNIKLVSGLQA